MTEEGELLKAKTAIDGIHSQIMNSNSCTENLRRTGFTFGVLVLTEEVKLLELNPFGAMSGWGSCLFQWVEDAQVLYGLDEKVEVRVCC